MNVFLLQAALRQQMQVAAFVRMRKRRCWGMVSYGQTHQTEMGLGDV